MKIRPFFLLALATLPAALLADSASRGATPTSPPPPPEPPVPVVQGAGPAPAPAVESAPTGYEQQLYGPATSLIAPEKAQQVVASFRTANDKLKKPRYLIYVNRELVDEASGLRVTGRKERTESVQGEYKSTFETDPNAPKSAAPAAGAQTQVNVHIGDSTTGEASAPGKGAGEGKGTKVVAENTYSYRERGNGTQADKQTVRDIERLFGRPLRAAGARLADQRTAATLIADKPLDHFTTATNESARKDREALAKVADVVVEILISSRVITVPEVSGDKVYSVPDIQATAIRLSDSAIIGQASASDVLGKDRDAGRVVRKFDVKDIAEATALALMEDITLTGE